MELQLENVRNTIFGKLSMKPREASKAAAFDYAKIAVIIFSSVLLGRNSLVLCDLSIAGSRSLTVLMHKEGRIFMLCP